MKVLGEEGEEGLGLGGIEVEEGDGVVVGGVIDGEVKTFVGEISEELVEEIDGGDVDGGHNNKIFEVFEMPSDQGRAAFII